MLIFRFAGFIANTCLAEESGVGPAQDALPLRHGSGFGKGVGSGDAAEGREHRAEVFDSVSDQVDDQLFPLNLSRDAKQGRRQGCPASTLKDLRPDDEVADWASFSMVVKMTQEAAPGRCRMSSRPVS